MRMGPTKVCEEMANLIQAQKDDDTFVVYPQHGAVSIDAPIAAGKALCDLIGVDLDGALVAFARLHRKTTKPYAKNLLRVRGIHRGMSKVVGRSGIYFIGKPQSTRSLGGLEMKKVVALAALALAVPSLALAAKPPAPGNSQNSHGKAAPKVMYVLRGTITAYTAASGTTNGSVSLLVNSANHHGATLKSQTLTFPISSSTKVVLHDGAAVAVNDKGVVKVRGPKNLAPTDNLATVLQALTAFQVIDQGPAS
jgi:hypothetical protein